MIYAIWNDVSNFGIVDALVVALVAILLVFLVLTIIILITTAFQKGMDGIEAKTKILPKKENQILDEDPDAAVAVIVASIDFNRETGKEPEVISIKRED